MESFLNFDQFCFNDPINAAIKAAGYLTPTPIQKQAIPFVLQGRDVLALSQTGTGKTAAFILPILHRLNKGASKKPRVLILEPTRELAEQIHRAIGSLSDGSRVRSIPVYGGINMGSQRTALQRGVEIISACPGRLLDHIERGSVDLSSVETFVLDEADRMCDMGFLPDIRRILGYLPIRRQTLFFSATMPGNIRALAGSILKDPACVQIGNMSPVETVSHTLYPISEGLKIKLLLTVLKETATGRVLIFTRTKRRACRLTKSLTNEGFRASSLQGDMTQNRRQSAIDGFRAGKCDILVATDIAARGIDVLDISHVINYDMPDTADAYTHRIGRTGRASRTGEALTFIVQTDEAIVFQIEKSLGERIERRQMPGLEVPYFHPPNATLQKRPAQSQRKFRLSVSARRRRIRARG